MLVLSVNYGFANTEKEEISQTITSSENQKSTITIVEKNDAIPSETKDLKSENESPRTEEHKTTSSSKGSFEERVFKKAPSLASSVIIKVYNQGKFMGIVLIERGRPPLGKALPGGIIRYEETCEDCVIRTARDECGLNIQNIKQFHVYSSSDRDPRSHMIDIVFTAQCTEFIPSAGTDAKHAFVCPINEIPWDRLAFDHAQILKDFLDFELSKDNKELRYDLNFPAIIGKKEREAKDLKEISKNAYRPPFLATTVIIEVYEKDVFKGIVMIERGLEPYGKALPGGPVQYGETVQYTAKREMKEECNLDLTNIQQFRVYDSLHRDPRRRCIDAVHISRCNNVIPQAGSDAAKLWVCPLDKIPWNELVFDHAEILRDYLVWREGSFHQNLHNP
jgi:8-oxo-dGTP diphosphatase